MLDVLEALPVSHGLTRYHALCELEDGGTVRLVTRASNEARACHNLHENYNILCVLDMLSEAEAREHKRHTNTERYYAASRLT